MTNTTASFVSSSGVSYSITKRLRDDAPAHARHPYDYVVSSAYGTTSYGLRDLPAGLVDRFGMDDAEAKAVAVKFVYGDSPSYATVKAAMNYPSFYAN